MSLSVHFFAWHDLSWHKACASDPFLCASVLNLASESVSCFSGHEKQLSKSGRKRTTMSTGFFQRTAWPRLHSHATQKFLLPQVLWQIFCPTLLGQRLQDVLGKLRTRSRAVSTFATHMALMLSHDPCPKRETGPRFRAGTFLHWTGKLRRIQHARTLGVLQTAWRIWSQLDLYFYSYARLYIHI